MPLSGAARTTWTSAGSGSGSDSGSGSGVPGISLNGSRAAASQQTAPNRSPVPGNLDVANKSRLAALVASIVTCLEVWTASKIGEILVLVERIWKVNPSLHSPSFEFALALAFSHGRQKRLRAESLVTQRRTIKTINFQTRTPASRPLSHIQLLQPAVKTRFHLVAIKQRSITSLVAHLATTCPPQLIVLAKYRTRYAIPNDAQLSLRRVRAIQDHQPL